MNLPTERDRSGFRKRGREMTRIETFTDAAFAFAMTLLVISLDPPASFVDLRAVMMDIPIFVLSATLLMVFWWGHHEWSRRFGLDDGPTIVLSCLLVFTVLVYVYPLRFMFGLMMAWIGQLSGVQVGSGSISVTSAREVQHLFAIYGFGFMAMSLSLLLLNLHAWRQRYELKLDRVETVLTRGAIGVWSILLSAGALSTTLAFVLPPRFVGMEGWAYSLLPIIMPLYGRRVGRQARDAAGQTEGAAGTVATGRAGASVVPG